MLMSFLAALATWAHVFAGHIPSVPERFPFNCVGTFPSSMLDPVHVQGCLFQHCHRYRRVFVAFRSETQGVSGRGRTKGKFSILQYREGEEHRRRQKLKTGFELMSQNRYIQFFTSEVPADDQLTEAEARLAWVRDKKSQFFEKDGRFLHCFNLLSRFLFVVTRAQFFHDAMGGLNCDDIRCIMQAQTAF